MVTAPSVGADLILLWLEEPRTMTSCVCLVPSWEVTFPCASRSQPEPWLHFVQGPPEQISRCPKDRPLS